MTHTPGPWTVQSIDSTTANVVSEDFGTIVIVHDYQHNSSRIIPDASLIAAAPDLLEALEALVGENGDLHSAEAHDKAYAALKKAKGQGGKQ